MRLLIDTDLFCELGVADLLLDAIRLLGCELSDCARLPALPYMLRRGSLPRKFGSQECERLLPLARQIPTAPDPSGPWLDRLVTVQGIDAGEAQLLAAAAAHSIQIMTGDERSLLAVGQVDGFSGALAGRIVTRVAILLALCDNLGPEVVRRRVARLATGNTTIRICFSSATADPREGLESYYQSAVQEMAPLVLWNPRVGGRP
jgi:hypothetical protein